MIELAFEPLITSTTIMPVYDAREAAVVLGDYLTAQAYKIGRIAAEDRVFLEIDRDLEMRHHMHTVTYFGWLAVDPLPYMICEQGTPVRFGG